MRAMMFIRDRIENGTFKPHELMPSIQELADQTGHSPPYQQQGVAPASGRGLGQPDAVPGYVARPRPVISGPRPVAAANGHYGSPVGWGLGGATHGER
jgi:hypothetical protein